MSFIKFQKIFEKFSKLADFWPKNDHFARFSRRDFETFFSTEIVSGPSGDGFWIILNFGDFMGLQSCQEGRF